MTGDTQISVVNLAMGHISQRSITSISDTNSVQAVAANRIWTPALGEALRANDWAFARVIALLVATTSDYDPELYDYLYAYAMPTSCQALRSVFWSYTSNKILGERYERVYDPTNAEELILTNVGGDVEADYAYARYTYNMTDPVKWDAAFVASFSYLLAAKLAPILIGVDAKETAQMMQFYNVSISDSSRQDSYEGTQQRNEPNEIVESRG